MRFSIWLVLFWLLSAPVLGRPGADSGYNIAVSGGGGGCTAGTFGIDSNAGAIATGSNSSSSTSQTATISTTSCPDEIIVGVGTSSAPTVTSPHLTFTQRGGVQSNTYEFIAQSSGALTSEVITVTQSPAGFLGIIGAAVTGIHAAAPFDANAAIPNSAGTCTWTTSNANDYFIALSGAGPSLTPQAGWTNLGNPSGGAWVNLTGKLFAATQTAFSSTNAYSAGAFNCDALIQGP